MPAAANRSRLFRRIQFLWAPAAQRTIGAAVPPFYDLHVHSAPCVVPRIADDRETVEWYEQAGFAGCVLKGHAEPTAGRAVAAGSGRRVRVRGAIVLNHAVGGLNPDAVDTALALGARVVWMPTIDAEGHLEAGLPRPAGASQSRPIAVPPRDPRAETPVRRILAAVAAADAVAATGHLTGAEAAWFARAARDAGVRRILLTHPTFTVPGLAPGDLGTFVELGALVEITAYQLLHQPGCDAAALAAAVRAAGLRNVVLSSDAGQPDSPPAPEALQLLVEALAAQGVDRAALEACASELPQALVEA
jgi:hypothetical protein